MRPLGQKALHLACGAALALLAHGVALAGDVKVISAAAVQVPLTELAQQFEQATGNRVVLEFSTAGGVETRVRGGAAYDLVINAANRLQALAADGRVGPASARSLGVVRMGVAVRKGGRVPDISSTAAFRASLLSADSVAYGDPAKGATTGIHFSKMVDKLGIVEAMRGKSQLAANGLEVMKLVADGKAELGITQISEILHVKGDTLVGPLPQELQLASNYSVALGSAAPTPAAAQFAELIVSEQGKALFRHAGFD